MCPGSMCAPCCASLLDASAPPAGLEAGGVTGVECAPLQGAAVAAAVAEVCDGVCLGGGGGGEGPDGGAHCCASLDSL